MTFVRVGGRWFRCDDAWVTDAQQGDIREEDVYMLFYMQQSA